MPKDFIQDNVTIESIKDTDRYLVQGNGSLSIIADQRFWDLLNGKMRDSETGEEMDADIVKIRYKDKVYTLEKEGAKKKGIVEVISKNDTIRFDIGNIDQDKGVVEIAGEEIKVPGELNITKDLVVELSEIKERIEPFGKKRKSISVYIRIKMRGSIIQSGWGKERDVYAFNFIDTEC